MTVFNREQLRDLYKPDKNSSGEDNGQLTIIGGSSLFFGAPLFCLKVASRIVDMVFFATPEKSVGYVAEQMKSKLLSYIWIPWDDVEKYIEKSDSALIGPGFMRFTSEKDSDQKRTIECDEECQKTRQITKELLNKYPQKRWVIDAGSLQCMDSEWIPSGAIVTPNKKEFKLLFGSLSPSEAAKKYDCIVVVKGPVTTVNSATQVYEIHGGNPGLTKGGTGDVQAGLTAALLAKNEPLFAACAAAQIVKDAGDSLYKKQGIYFNADDLSAEIPQILAKV